MADHIIPPSSAIENYVPPTPPPHRPEFIITDVRVFDGNDILPSSYDITVSHGTITSINPTNEPTTDSSPSAIPTISGKNRTLLPGLIDSHVHITHPSQLDMLISAGITTVFDMACFPAPLLSSIREASSLPPLDSELPIRPAFFSVGTPATTFDSRHAKMVPFTPEGGTFLNPTLGGDELEREIKRWTEKRIEEGSEYIKIIADTPGPSREMVSCLVQEARNRGKLSVAHAACLEAWDTVVHAGADMVTHVPADGVLGDEFLQKLLAGGNGTEANVKAKAVVPTLVMSRAIAEFRAKMKGHHTEGFVDMVMKNSFGSVKKLREVEQQGNGVVILAGTDANTLPFANVKHGESLVEELELLVDGAGFTPVEALRAATSLPANWWGLENTGVIKVGAKADLLLVEGEPWKEVGDLRKVVGVWREGRAAVLKL